MFCPNKRTIQVQGTCLARESYALFRTLIVLICLSSWGGLIHAQNFEWVPASDWEFTLTAPADTVFLGDTLKMEIHLGRSGMPTKNAIGVDVLLSLSAGAKFPDSLGLNSENSWLFGSTGISATKEFSEQNQKLGLVVIREDSFPSSDYGLILQIPVIITADSLPVTSLSVGGGGLVLVDNVDMLNPENGEGPGELFLFSMKHPGTILQRPAGQENDLEGLTPGLYFIVTLDPSGKRSIRKVLLR